MEFFLDQGLACCGAKELFIHVRHKISRAENIDLNVITHQLQSHDTRQLNDRRLTRAISHKIARCNFPRIDATLMIRPLFLSTMC